MERRGGREDGREDGVRGADLCARLIAQHRTCPGDVRCCGRDADRACVRFCGVRRIRRCIGARLGLGAVPSVSSSRGRGITRRQGGISAVRIERIRRRVRFDQRRRTALLGSFAQIGGSAGITRIA
jgi:hypothetical protein